MTEFALPSGLRVDLRPLTLNDDVVLFEGSDERPFPDIAASLLEASTTRVVNPGPYTLDENGAVDWRGVFPGDLRAAVLAFRRINDPSGEKLAIDVIDPTKPKAPPIQWNVDIRMMEEGGDVIDYPLSTEHADQIRAGELFTTEVAERVVTFRHLTVQDWIDADLGAVKFQDDTTSPEDRARYLHETLRRQIVKVDGIENLDILRWLQKLEWTDATRLDQATRDIACDIDLVVEVETTDGRTLEGAIPFTSDMLLRQKMTPRSKREDRKAAILAARKAESGGTSGDGG